MLKALSKVIVVVAMFIAFIGQSMAFITVNSYQSSPVANISINGTENIIKNVDHKDNNETIADCCDVECCDVDCVCLASGCLSLTYLNSEIIATQIAVFSEAIFLPQTEQIKSITSLLYRPPIFTS